MRLRSTFVLLALVATAPLACGGGGGSNPITTPNQPPTPASPNDVLVENNSFNPATLTVAPGTSVKWTWATCTGSNDPYNGGAGQICVDHSVTWDDGTGTSATQSKGTYQRAFATAGTYKYHCVVHGTAMSGTVVIR